MVYTIYQIRKILLALYIVNAMLYPRWRSLKLCQKMRWRLKGFFFLGAVLVLLCASIATRINYNIGYVRSSTSVRKYRFFLTRSKDTSF